MESDLIPFTYTLPLPLRHLRLRLRALNRSLLAAIMARRETTERQTSAIESGDVDRSEPSSEVNLVMQVVQTVNQQSRVFISDDQVDFLLSEVEDLCGGDDEDASDEEKQLREEARRDGIELPLDRLEFELPLSPTQMDAILLCAAPEFDQAYENIYAFILNDVTRRFPCPELFCGLTDEIRERFDRRLELGRFGRLRILGVIVPQGEAPTDLRQELRLAPGMFDYLLDGRGDPADLCRDPDEVALSTNLPLPPQVDPALLQRLGKALRDQVVDVLGIWGPRRAGPEDVALAIARSIGRPLRRWAVPDPRSFSAEHEKSLRQAFQIASVLNATLWIQTDTITDSAASDSPRLTETLIEVIAKSKVRVILTGSRPWQPTRLLAARPFYALALEVPDLSKRIELWKNAVPEASPGLLDELAARYPVNGTEALAVATVASTSRRIATPANGSSGSSDQPDPLLAASAVMDRMNASSFTTLIEPVRGPDDLILPEPLKKQVLEIANFHKAWPDVASGWGFGRMMTGPGGIKALFAGESGTGKTLAAEVIARIVGRPLLKFDLAKIVSKWVGDTEKHLDAVFLEAQERDSVLCLDEADALLGKRGEIRQGTDRYANLEVSYLLQRLEDHPGLVVMATNHKENIDPAFMRRFQTILTFLRPGPAERREIWRISFPTSPAYEKDNEVNIDDLARLDMTGAEIVDSARTAALLASSSTTKGTPPKIGLKHVAEAIKRQYIREARLLTARELKLLGEEP